MLARKFLLPSVVLLAWATLAASRALADSTIPLEVSSSGPTVPTTSAIFRNELTNVVIKDDSAQPIDFDDLAKGTSKNGSTLVISQKLGDQVTLEQSTSLGVQKTSETDALPLTDDSSATSYNVMAANWTPISALSFRISDTTEDDLTANSSNTASNTDPLLMDHRQMEATFQAAPGTKLWFCDSDERNFDYSSYAYDTYHNTGVTFSQMLGKTNLTWNATPSWEQDTMGGEWGSIQAGPQFNTSLDWKPAATTKWSLGGGWNHMDGIANAVAQSTKTLFLAYDHAVSQNLKFLLRTDYENQSSPKATAPTPTDLDQITFKVGQKYALSQSLSAQLDVSHSFEQQTGEPWATSESMATFSLQKSF